MQGGLLARLRTGKGQIGLGRLTLRLETLWQGGWMLVATVVTGVLNYLSNVFVGRMLGPADYSIFASMVSLSIIFMVVSGILQTVVTNYVARLRGLGLTSEVGALFVYVLKRLLPWSLGGAAALFLLARPLAAFLQLPSAVPVVVMTLFMIPTMFLPVVYGVQRGLQRFSALGWTQISTAVLRLAAAIGFIAMGLGANGAVASLPISGLGALVVGMMLLVDVFRHQEGKTTPRLEGLFSYSINATIALVCFAVLTNGDVMLVKSRFAPTEAGLYSAIAVLGKTTLWISGAVVALLLPKATERHARGQSVIGLLRKSMLAVGVLCGSITVVFSLFPSLIVGTFFGKQYLGNAALLGLYGLGMTLYSLVNIWLIYYLALQEKRYTYILLASVVLLATFLALCVSNLTQVVVNLATGGFVLCLSGEFLFLANGGRLVKGG